ncbi:general transcription factor 3C polypeptide 6 [Eucyclogobius newberryi]|uniref:general transcription factor 3C polypeptide 6 n=1 Tax=Eucyclogobius newberryi TaxID=166745 RepID=UPI003B592B6B
MDDEWEEEEQLVVVELAGTLSNDFLTKGNSTCKMLDIDSDKPFMQVGQFVFAGEYEDALGTSVMFEELPQKAGKDCPPELKYMCHTVKKLMMQRVFLTEKKEGETSQGNTLQSHPFQHIHIFTNLQQQWHHGHKNQMRTKIRSDYWRKW